MMWRAGVRWAGVAVLLAGVLASKPALAAGCRNTGNFNQWLAAFKQDARAQGISARTINAAQSWMTFDPGIVKKDRRQYVFSQSFLEFSGRMVAKYRLQRGPKLIRKYNKMFARIERQYGVPAPVIVGFWGLETDFGAFIGDLPTLRSLATLAFDCRRPDMFRTQLLAALRIIERGDLTPEKMVGPWAGELGQTQFLPSHYLDYGVDYDGDGRRDLLKSVPDALASTANLLANSGWKRGQPWLREVRVPAKMPWDQADLTIRHPSAQWARWGVRLANGKRLPGGALPVSLLLPMGRFGPAFLAYPNFYVYLEWNKSMVYATTAAYFATRLAGAPPLKRGNAAVTPLSFKQLTHLQRQLVRRGYDVGKVDGIIGVKTRAAVKSVQKKLGLPADSYPTKSLLDRL